MSWQNWVILIVAIVMTGVIVYLCMKYQWMKILAKILIVVAVLGSGVYTGYQIFLLNTATGGTHGKLEGVYGKNEIEVVDNLKFNLHNTEFKAVGDETDYELTVDIEQIMELDTTKNYNIFINDVPCSNASYYLFSGNQFITANYTYSYYTESDYLEMTDSLKISIVFYKNYTRISLKTDGGEDAVKYWNSYVNKNNFEISVRETDYRRNKNFVILNTVNQIFEKAIEKYHPLFDIYNTIIDGENIYVQGIDVMLDGISVDSLYMFNIPGLGTELCDSEDELAQAVNKIDPLTIGNTFSVDIDYYLKSQKGINNDDIAKFREEVESKTKYYVISSKLVEKVSTGGSPGTDVAFVKITDNKVNITKTVTVYAAANLQDKNQVNWEGMISYAALKDALGDSFKLSEFVLVDPENPDKIL